MDNLFFENNLNAISTGYKEIDKAIGGGMKSGDIVIIAAKPGSAKTMLCLNIINNNIKSLNTNGQKVLYFCPDMHIRYIYRRMWCIYTGKSQEEISNANKQDIYNDIVNMPIITSEASGIEEIIRVIRYYKNKIKIVIVDYIQLITCSRSMPTKNEQISRIIADLKKIIREDNILLILIYKVNR